MPFLLLVAVAAACMGMLNSIRRFMIPASSPALFNVVFILCTVILVPVFTRTGIEPVMALSFAMLLGGVTQIAVQWPALRKEGYRHQWMLDPSDSALRSVLMLMGPGTIGVAAGQINLLINTSLATAEPGAVSALGYAFRLMYMPIGIFGVSVATAAIPDLARHAAAHAYSDMRDILSFGVRLMLMLSVPASVGLMVLAVPIVELIFQHGAFGPSDTQKVATALLFYAPAIAGYSIVKIAGPSSRASGRVGPRRPGVPAARGPARGHPCTSPRHHRRGSWTRGRPPAPPRPAGVRPSRPKRFEETPVEDQGPIGREAATRSVTGPEQVLDGLSASRFHGRGLLPGEPGETRCGSGRKVMGEEIRNFFDSVACDLLEPGTDGRVSPGSPSPRQRVVRDVVEEGVAERIEPGR